MGVMIDLLLWLLFVLLVLFIVGKVLERRSPRHEVVPWFFRWFKFQAIMLYPFILYRSTSAFSRYELHELVHVRQLEELGWLRFYVEYLYQNIRYGYEKNRFELEAWHESGVR